MPLPSQSSLSPRSVPETSSPVSFTAVSFAEATTAHYPPPLGAGAAFHRAVASGSLRQVQRLLRVWPELLETVNREGQTALHAAAEFGYFDIVQLLVGQGTSIGRCDAQGYSAAFYAAREEHDEVLLFLLEHEARQGAQREWEARPQNVLPLGSMTEKGSVTEEIPSQQQQDEALAESALASPSWMEFQWRFESESIPSRLVALLEELVRVGSQAGVATVWIHLCESVPDDEFVPRSMGGSTPLHWSTLQNNEGMVALLLQLGCDPTWGDTHGETALHWACEGSSAAIITLLLRAGANPDQPNVSGQTAREVAQARGYASLLPPPAQVAPPPFQVQSAQPHQDSTAQSSTSF